MMTTTCVSSKEISEKWFCVDAEGVTLGKLASKVACLLRGKHLPQFSPHVNFLQKVVVLNATKIKVSGKKMTDKIYHRHTGYVGHLRSISLQDLMKKHPCKAVEMAIKGMLPHNKLGNALYRNLFVYADGQHKHAAQKPVSIEVV